MLEAEQDYIQKAKAGDPAAFGALYDHYAAPIYRFIAGRVGTSAEAEDLLHEVFLSAWQKMPSYVEQGFPFSSWLYRIARNRVIDHYRTKRQHLSLDDPFLDLQDQLKDETSPSAEANLDKAFSLEQVRAVMQQLTPDQQDVLVLRFVEEKTPKEIAIILGKREGSVRIIQFRAIAALKKLLGKNK